MRDHPMYLSLKDLVFDLYCKNPRAIDPKVAAGPNLTYLYESTLKSKASSKVIKHINLNSKIPSRKHLHQSLHKLSQNADLINEEAKQDINGLKQMNIDELKQALVRYGINTNFNGTYLHLDLKNENVRNMTEYYKNYQFPDIEKLQIWTSKDYTKATNKFLQTNFPSKVGRFYFYSKDGASYKSDFNVFKDKLLPKIKNVDDLFWIHNFYLTKDDLKNVFASSSHLESLVIYQCFTDMQTYDFENLNYAIKNLYLVSFGNSKLANWQGNPNKFDELIKQMSETTLSQSLKHLSLYSCQYDLNSAMSTMQKYGMGDVRLTHHSISF